MDANRQDVDLSLVVDAVRQASDRELAILSEINNKLDGRTLAASPKDTSLSLDTRGIEKAISQGISKASFDSLEIPSDDSQNGLIETKQNQRTERESESKRNGEIELTFDLPQLPTQPQQAKREEKAVEQDESLKMASPISDLLSSEGDEDRGKQAPVIVNVEQPETASKAIDTSILDDVPDRLEKAVSDAMAQFEGYWEDANGKLRRPDGRYASKEERSTFKDAQQTALERQIEKQTDTEKENLSVFAKLASTLKELSIKNATDFLKEENDATDAAGAATGGSFFYSAKELYHLGQDAIEAADSMPDKVKSLKEKFKESKLGSLFNRQGQDSDSEAQKANQTGSVEKPLNANEVIELNESSERSLVGDSGSSNKERAQIGNPKKDYSDSTSASEISQVKEQAYQANVLEILSESNSERDNHFSNLLDKLDDLISVSKSASGNQGGLFDLAGSLFDGQGGADSGQQRRNGKRGRLRSVMSGIGEKASSIAGKGASMAGAAFTGMSKIGSVAGKAIPLLAPALMAYEAFSGFSDKEKQKEVFNLSDGQEATTGQKSSIALANVLDMGGLVSGGAGLLGSALGAMGFEGAKEALSFDSGDMAKGIYKMFGGTIDDDEQSKADRTKDAIKTTSNAEKDEVTKSAEAYHSALISGDTKTMNELDSQNSKTVDHKEVVERSKAEGVSYKDAYESLKQEKIERQRERESVAKETGMDISGMINHPELGSVYSPEMKAQQMASVDAEIERRKEADAVAVLTKVADSTQNNSVTKASHEAYLSQEVSQDKSVSESSAKAEKELSNNQAIATSTSIQRNERVSELQSQLAMKSLKDGDKPQTVELSKQSVDAIGRAIGGNDGGKTTIIKQQSYSRKPESTAKPSGSIPLNFEDRTLQRQSADLE